MACMVKREPLDVVNIRIDSREFDGTVFMSKAGAAEGSELQVQKESKLERKAGTKSYYIKKRVSLYKTEICKSFEASNICKYGTKCQFAHSAEELREVERHPRYKTELCRTYLERGECPYGKRCCFIHSSASDLEGEYGAEQPPAWMEEGVASDASEDVDVEMAQITEDEYHRKANVGEPGITEDDQDKLQVLKKYKNSRSYMRKRTGARAAQELVSQTSVLIPMCKSYSSMWTPEERCLVFVGAGERVSRVSGLGAAPGRMYLRASQPSI